MPVDPSDLGAAARGSEPSQEQCFVGNTKVRSSLLGHARALASPTGNRVPLARGTLAAPSPGALTLAARPSPSRA